MGHGVHAVAPMPEYVPAGHGLAACALETELPLHFERSSLPDQVDGQTEPDLAPRSEATFRIAAKGLSLS